MDTPSMRPYALKAGEGWTYHDGIDFIVKAGELGKGRRLAVIEYTTRRGEEPPDHTHPTEDEIFYVLQGALTFRCGEDTFELDDPIVGIQDAPRWWSSLNRDQEGVPLMSKRCQ
jgi:quercetin dioxygenase-like cupin family protein